MRKRWWREWAGWICMFPALLFLISFAGCSNSRQDSDRTRERAQAMAVEWCRDRYGIEVSVVSVSVHYNSPIGTAFQPTGNGGYTSRATVLVQYGEEEFEVECDTASKFIYDYRQHEQIQQAEVRLLSEHLGLPNLLSCTYFQFASDRPTKYRMFDGSNIAQTLSSAPMQKPLLICAGEDLSHIRAEDILGAGCQFHDYENSKWAVIINYRSEQYADLISYESVSANIGLTFPGIISAFAPQIESALHLSRSGDSYKTVYYEFPLERWSDGVTYFVRHHDDPTFSAPGGIERLEERLEWDDGYLQLTDLFAYTSQARESIYFYYPLALLEAYQDYSDLVAVDLSLAQLESGEYDLSYIRNSSLTGKRQCDHCSCELCKANPFTLCDELCSAMDSCNWILVRPPPLQGSDGDRRVITLVGMP